MIEHRHRVVTKHPRRIVDGWPARPAGAAVVENDHPMIFSEFRQLKNLPDLAIRRRLAAKQKRLPPAMLFVIDLRVLDSHCWHLGSPSLPYALVSRAPAVAPYPLINSRMVLCARSGLVKK